MAQPILPPVVEAGGPRNFGGNYILWWNDVALDLNRVTHSLSGPQSGPPLSARALGIFHLAIHDAYFSVMPYNAADLLGPISTYLGTTSTLPTAVPVSRAAGTADTPSIRVAARDAVAGASMTVLNKLYRQPEKKDPSGSQKSAIVIGSFIDKALADYIELTATDSTGGVNVLSASFNFGVGVANAILAALEIKANEPGTDKGAYVPKHKDYFFDDEPTHPVVLVNVDPNDQSLTPAKKASRQYHGPWYGFASKRLAAHKDHIVADPPINPHDPASATPDDILEYKDAVEDVHRMGGSPNDKHTLRQEYQTVGGLFWAYDGARLIGTPPRLYNQILRQIAYDKRSNTQLDSEDCNAEFARLFALANAALADAGIFAWREKYTFELWRPLSGVRQDPSAPHPRGLARPTWLTFGAPQTNSHATPFKPPFPAYPSGHATFGAALFQMMRLFYRKRDDNTFDITKATDLEKPDDIRFKFTSDEMNGINRDLDADYDPTKPITDQPGIVRTKYVREFKSLWEAMFDNALSRVWLGVHWRFDAFSAKDVLRGNRPPYHCEDDGSTAYKDAHDVKYETLGHRTKAAGPNETLAGVGGVPLGIAVANDIWEHMLQPRDASLQPPNGW